MFETMVIYCFVRVVKANKRRSSEDYDNFCGGLDTNYMVLERMRRVLERIRGGESEETRLSVTGIGKYEQMFTFET